MKSNNIKTQSTQSTQTLNNNYETKYAQTLCHNAIIPEIIQTPPDHSPVPEIIGNDTKINNCNGNANNNCNS